MARADINFHVEVHCDNCGNRNLYHQLNSVHTNLKNNLNKDNKEFTIAAKCEHCNKYFEIKGVRYA